MICSGCNPLFVVSVAGADKRVSVHSHGSERHFYWPRLSQDWQQDVCVSFKQCWCITLCVCVCVRACMCICVCVCMCCDMYIFLLKFILLLKKCSWTLVFCFDFLCFGSPLSLSVCVVFVCVWCCICMCGTDVYGLCVCVWVSDVYVCGCAVCGEGVVCICCDGVGVYAVALFRQGDINVL